MVVGKERKARDLAAILRCDEPILLGTQGKARKGKAAQADLDARVAPKADLHGHERGRADCPALVLGFPGMAQGVQEGLAAGPAT